MDERTAWAGIGTLATRKLYSCQGTLLGTVSYPAHWDDLIRQDRPVNFAADPEWRSTWDCFEAGHDGQYLTFRYGVLAPCWRVPGAVELHRITPEEFERLRECSFAPGAGYLRSLLEG